MQGISSDFQSVMPDGEGVGSWYLQTYCEVSEFCGTKKICWELQKTSNIYFLICKWNNMTPPAYDNIIWEIEHVMWWLVPPWISEKWSFANRGSAEAAKLNLLPMILRRLITDHGPQQICTGCSITSSPPTSPRAEYPVDSNTATLICSASQKAILEARKLKQPIPNI